MMRCQYQTIYFVLYFEKLSAAAVLFSETFPTRDLALLFQETHFLFVAASSNLALYFGSVPLDLGLLFQTGALLFT